jgi:hypothetical protein
MFRVEEYPGTSEKASNAAVFCELIDSFGLLVDPGNGGSILL